MSMIRLGFEEIEKEPKKAMALCSSAIRDAIRQYGFATTLDFVVRISNYDPIVRDLLPFFPSIASAVMLETLYERPRSKNRERSPEGPVTESELLKILAGQENKEITKPT
jgi:hypothetical protein